MRAVQITDWGAKPVVREVPEPAPSGSEILLRVDAAGLCQSDLHVMDAPPGTFDYPLPVTLGHEVAGTVVAVGPDADASWIDTPVVVHGIWACGHCRNCGRGRENYCLSLLPGTDGRSARIGNGLGHPGGLAERMLVPSDAVLVPTRGLDPVRAAPLADAGLTAYHVISSNSDLLDASTVAVVIGVGGLGHMAVQILRALGVGTVLAVDIHPGRRELARELGADSVSPSVADALTALHRHRGADLVLDFAGAASTVEPGLEILAPGGRLVVVGSAGGRVLVGKDRGLAPGWQVSAPFWGTRDDLAAVVEMARAGDLTAETTTVVLDEVPDAYERLRRGELSGRGVALPHR
ncbi:NAD(P)-dependent alcohol dehydrogenase [Williamsia sp. SKLECPSW1]